jgi:hypothetical protein
MVIVLAAGLLIIAAAIHAGAIWLCNRHKEPPTSGSKRTGDGP